MAAGAALIAVTGVAGVAGSQAVASTATRPPRGGPASVAVPNVDAARAAADLVAARPAILHAGPDDKFVQVGAKSSLGWRYVRYDRTYRGLPVVGGDFVVVVDPSGHVRDTSVPQKAAITGVNLHPSVSRARADEIAAGQLRSVDKVLRTELVVSALGQPRLAWEVTEAGTGRAGASSLTVLVDAGTGAVIRTLEGISHDSGHGYYNGPSPLSVNSTPMLDANGNIIQPARYFLGFGSGGFECDPSSIYRTDDQAVTTIVNGVPFKEFVWGNGDPADVETACVDAFFDTEVMYNMETSWLGASPGGPIGENIDPDGGSSDDSFNVFTGITMGRSSASGAWLSNLDSIAHEYGHAIDDNPLPSGGNTKEFIANAFGTAAEWFANEPAPYDTPDWIMGDKIPGEHGRANFYQPSALGGQDCFNVVTDSIDEHVAAGPGDHWFYLLAEGSNPANGQPASSTCNFQPVAGGLGVKTAIQILFNAVLRHGSFGDGSYPQYRLWTLQAAQQLFPNDCNVVAQVKAAWDAVSVPYQSGEPDVCVPNVMGASQATASSAITGAGLTVGSITQQTSLTPVGTVIGESPGAGTIVTLGTAVNLTISAGGRSVPNVLSFPKDDAVRILQSAGFAVSVSGQKKCTDPGMVFLESPRGGAVVQPGSTVTIKYDSGTLSTCRVIA